MPKNAKEIAKLASQIGDSKRTIPQRKQALNDLKGLVNANLNDGEKRFEATLENFDRSFSQFMKKSDELEQAFQEGMEHIAGDVSEDEIDAVLREVQQPTKKEAKVKPPTDAEFEADVRRRLAALKTPSTTDAVDQEPQKKRPAEQPLQQPEAPKKTDTTEPMTRVSDKIILKKPINANIPAEATSAPIKQTPPVAPPAQAQAVVPPNQHRAETKPNVSEPAVTAPAKTSIFSAARNFVIGLTQGIAKLLGFAIAQQLSSKSTTFTGGSKSSSGQASANAASRQGVKATTAATSTIAAQKAPQVTTPTTTRVAQSQTTASKVTSSTQNQTQPSQQSVNKKPASRLVAQAKQATVLHTKIEKSLDELRKIQQDFKEQQILRRQELQKKRDALTKPSTKKSQGSSRGPRF